MRINWIGYNWISKRMNRRYWKDSLTKPLFEDVLNSLDTLDKLTEFMKSITYRPDPLFGAFHWIQDPVTTVHRGSGDCDDYAWFWYHGLKAIGHEAHIYILYRKKFWINWPVHFVCVWMDESAWLHVASNTESDMIGGYSFRHTAVTLSILNGASLVQAQELAGHADPKVTMRYFHNLDRLRDSAVDLNPIRLS